MNNLTPCPQCGNPMARKELMGLCPDCMLKAGLGSVADDTVAGQASRFVPPEVSEIAPLFPQLEVLEPLGCGGMGAVYKARQKNLDRFVALKILPAGIGSDPAFAVRFSREAKALAKLNHPNIVTIHDFGQAGELFYFLMEYVDGVNLGQLLRSGRISSREALAIVPQICDALQYAHDAGIVHRDIKPENILLDRRGRVKVADFGLAKLVGQADSKPADGEAASIGNRQSTIGNVIMGTPQYMAPEQREHPTEVDHRADIYSLGVVFYQMLTGELPQGDFAAPSKKVVVDVRLDEVVLRALEQRPELRYQHVSDVKTMVETIATTPAGTSRALPKKPGMVRIIEIFFNTTFTSPLAIKLANLSALGFLGSLGFLRALPLPGWERCAGFFGLYGLFGLIGAAFIAEMFVRAKAAPVPKPVESRAAPGVAGRLAYVAFAALYLAVAVGVLITAPWLPERVATHFGLEGHPNGWMTRTGYFAFVTAFPLLLALFFAGIAALTRVLPARFVNIPNRDFWLAPERRAATSVLIRHWLAGLLCLLTLFFAGLHVLTIIANRSTPPQLPMGGLLLLVIVFLLALMIWLSMFLMRFAETGVEPPGAAQGSQPPPLQGMGRAKRYGKLALALCLGGLVPPVMLLTMHLSPFARLGGLQWIGAFGIISLCEIAAIVLGILGWKSGEGKAAVIVAAVLPLLVVPGSLIVFRLMSQVSQERWLTEEQRNRAHLEKVEAVLCVETPKQLEHFRVRCDHIKVLASPALDLATIVLANPQELRGVGGSNRWTNINGLLMARPKGDSYWEVRGEQDLQRVRFKVQVPVPTEMIYHNEKAQTQVILSGQREELEKNLRAAFVLWLNERGVSYADVKVSAAQDLASAMVNYKGLQGLKRSDGTQIIGAASGIFALKMRGESEWAGTLLPGVLIELRPYATATVGLVMDGEGQPIPDVLLREMDGKWQMTTDADGRFPLPALTNNQQISFSMQAQGFAKRDNVSLFRDSAGWSVQPVRYMLRRTARISGRVLAPGGKPLAYAPLSLMTCYGPYRDGDRTGGFRSSGSSGTTANALRAVTDDQGNWHMEDVPAGCHILLYPWEGPTQDEVEQGRWRALKPAGQEVPLKDICGALVVETRDGQPVDGLILDLSRSTCRIAGRVLDQHAQPVAGAALDLFRRADKTDITGKIAFGAGLTGNDAYQIPKTDTAGRYEIRNLPPGDWKVTVHQGKAQGEELVRLTSVGEHATLDLRLTNIVTGSNTGR